MTIMRKSRRHVILWYGPNLPMSDNSLSTFSFVFCTLIIFFEFEIIYQHTGTYRKSISLQILSGLGSTLFNVYTRERRSSIALTEIVQIGLFINVLSFYALCNGYANICVWLWIKSKLRYMTHSWTFLVTFQPWRSNLNLFICSTFTGHGPRNP